MNKQKVREKFPNHTVTWLLGDGLGKLVVHPHDNHHFSNPHSVPRHGTRQFVFTGSHNNSGASFFISA